MNNITIFSELFRFYVEYIFPSPPTKFALAESEREHYNYNLAIPDLICVELRLILMYYSISFRHSLLNI